ncbi:chromosomal replication initiator protein DnaA [Campylobacter sp. faydin G-24]|uniref:Chromosomal replication initiator protein DnaA n=1 Tax=Campylobacter anatolicus TaxID=2829105 RepID=A0ABS5HJN4_9BACT|nr:chromosomal replication initiator protein DnaA [Campylobacter anatolicus]MBR8461369.1 chromosomal replication initiator protein DnaA [Campylobacter anatolicus]MBR8464448.1 chromosomal replication initiator protein DnaA [Campylobacter anatolicus]MBR8466239.1 chromosomal replication initiator protein DnaA [Campylobacter anatolicus]
MLVDEVLELLSGEISPNEYEYYIKQLKFNEKASSSDNIVFNAPNELISKFIQTRYTAKIAHLFEVKTGIKPNITITISNRPKSTKQVQVDVKQIKAQSTLLNPAYTFENFVVGDSNQFAYLSCKAAAEKLGMTYNPLFIYGSTGLGKTHLLQSVGNFCFNQGKVVICVTSEQFITDFTYNINNHSMERFRDKYRKCDVLLIDDVQFLGKTDKIQDEFFHTFNELHSKNGQIVMTSDRPPKTLKGFEERLKSRFEWGLIADITPPELDTKVAIIQKKCEFDKINLNKDVINYIATNMGDNIREIESAIINLNAYATLMRQEITLEFAKNVMRDQIKEKRKNINLDSIIDVVSKELNTKPSDIKSKSRVSNIVEARRIVIYLAKNLTPNSMPQIASYFGMKDHSAVSHNIKKINELIENNEIFSLRVTELKNKILTKG